MTPDGKKLVTFIPGDGIGKEVTDSARQIIEAANVKIEWDDQEAGAARLRQSVLRPRQTTRWRSIDAVQASGRRPLRRTLVEIRPGLWMIEGPGPSYLYRDADTYTLIDTGLSGDDKRLLK